MSLYLAGAPLIEVFPLLPPMGNLTLVVAALSYAGQLNVTAAADRERCPDVDVFVQGLQGALEELAQSSLAPRATDGGDELQQPAGRSVVGGSQ
jgi:hypothetical protein